MVNLFYDQPSALFSKNLQLINDGPLAIYDMYVSSTYIGDPSGTATRPYNTIQDAIDNALDGYNIFIKGTIIITTPVIIPTDKSLNFYGSGGTLISYALYDPANGIIFSQPLLGCVKKFTFNDMNLRGSGSYAIDIKSSVSTIIRSCEFAANGWNGTRLNTQLPQTDTWGNGGTLGYDSTQADLQSFYASDNVSDGGGIRVENSAVVIINESLFTICGTAIVLVDCSTQGLGFIHTNNVSTCLNGICLLSSTEDSTNGCDNMVISNNSIRFCSGNGIEAIGGINNTYGLNNITACWNAGLLFGHISNTTAQTTKVSDCNRSIYNYKGEISNGIASITISGDTISSSANYRTALTDIQVFNTGIPTTTTRIGLLLSSELALSDSIDRSNIYINDVKCEKQDYGIDFQDGSITNGGIRKTRVYLHDIETTENSTQGIRNQDGGKFYSLPYSNHTTDVTVLDISTDNISKTIFLKDGQDGNVIDSYPINSIKCIVDTDMMILQENTNKIILDLIDYDAVYIEGIKVAYVSGTPTSEQAEVANEINAVFHQTASSLAPDISDQSLPTLQLANFLISPELDVDSDLVTMWASDDSIPWLIVDQQTGLGMGVAPAHSTGIEEDPPDEYTFNMKVGNPFGIDTAVITIEVYAELYFLTKSVIFDGSSDYTHVTVSDTTFPISRVGNGSGASDAWSVECIVRTGGDFTQKKVLWSYAKGAGANDVKCFLGRQNKDILFEYGKNTERLRFITSGEYFTHDKWWELFVTYDGGTTGNDSGQLQNYYQRFHIWAKNISDSGPWIELTANGVPDGDDRDTSFAGGNGLWDSASDGYIGAHDAQDFYVGTIYETTNEWEGYVSRTTVYNGELTPTEIQAMDHTLDPEDQVYATASVDYHWIMGSGTTDVYPYLYDQANKGDITRRLQMFNMNAGDIVNIIP